MKLTKLNAKFYKISNLLPDKYGVLPSTDEAIKMLAYNQKLLTQSSICFDTLQVLKQERNKNVRNYFGDQLSERIHNPDGCGTITEAEYCRNQGMIPLCVNVIRAQGKSLVGVYLQDKYEPLVATNVREIQKLGEMLTIVMQNAYHSLNLYRVFPRGYEEYLISAIPAYRTGYDWDQRRKIKDVFVEQCDINRMFWDNNTSGKYFENVSLIGYLHDMSKNEVLKFFANNRQEKEAIEAIYNQCNTITATHQQFATARRNSEITFMGPADPDKCRVIEVWTKETREVYACHDTAKGEVYTVPCTFENEEEIKQINESRKQDMVENGAEAEEASLINYEYRVDDIWVCRYMAPNGAVLKQEDDPYLHGSHPFSIGAYPLVDGQVHSVVGDTLNAQRMLNREFMRMEAEENSRQKGFSIIDKKILEASNLTESEFGRRMTSSKGFAALKLGNKSINDVFHQFINSGAGTQYGIEKIHFYMDIINKITGNNGALRGEEAKANTPAALYAQQAQNANNNIADGQEWYNGLIEDVDYKLLMNILQNYDRDRYLDIVGKDYEKEINYVVTHDMRNILFKISLIKSPSTGTARALSENLLETLYNSKAIPAEIWLETTSVFGADKVLEKLKAYKQKQQEEANKEQELALQQLAYQQQRPIQQQQPGIPQQPAVIQ